MEFLIQRVKLLKRRKRKGKIKSVSLVALIFTCGKKIFAQFDKYFFERSYKLFQLLSLVIKNLIIHVIASLRNIDPPTSRRKFLLSLLNTRPSFHRESSFDELTRRLSSI